LTTTHTHTQTSAQPHRRLRAHPLTAPRTSRLRRFLTERSRHRHLPALRAGRRRRPSRCHSGVLTARRTAGATARRAAIASGHTASGFTASGGSAHGARPVVGMMSRPTDWGCAPPGPTTARESDRSLSWRHAARYRALEASRPPGVPWRLSGRARSRRGARSPIWNYAVPGAKAHDRRVGGASCSVLPTHSGRRPTGLGWSVSM